MEAEGVPKFLRAKQQGRVGESVRASATASAPDVQDLAFGDEDDSAPEATSAASPSSGTPAPGSQRYTDALREAERYLKSGKCMREPEHDVGSIATLLQTLSADVVDAVRFASLWVKNERPRPPTFLE